MYEIIQARIVEYLRGAGGSVRYADIVGNVSTTVGGYESRIGLVEALMELVNKGAIAAGTYFRRSPKALPQLFELALAPVSQAFAEHGEWATIAQIAAHTTLSAEEASILIHNLWWQGLLERDYRYAMPSSPQDAPQESAQSADTTPPPPVA